MGKHVPIRTCVGCGAKRPKRELVRIVRDKEGRVYLDVSGRMSGRGAYICPDLACLKKALKKGALQRSLRIGDISEEVINAMKRLISERGNEIK